MHLPVLCCSTKYNSNKLVFSFIIVSNYLRSSSDGFMYSQSILNCAVKHLINVIKNCVMIYNFFLNVCSICERRVAKLCVL